MYIFLQLVLLLLLLLLLYFSSWWHWINTLGLAATITIRRPHPLLLLLLEGDHTHCCYTTVYYYHQETSASAIQLLEAAYIYIYIIVELRSRILTYLRSTPGTVYSIKMTEVTSVLPHYHTVQLQLFTTDCCIQFH